MVKAQFFDHFACKDLASCSSCLFTLSVLYLFIMTNMENIRSLFLNNDKEALGKVSSSLRTTLFSKLRNIDISSCLEAGAVKLNQRAEKFIPENFLLTHKSSRVAALQ